MADSDPLAFFPVVDFDVGIIEGHGAITLSMHFLTHSAQSPDAADVSPSYLLSLEAACELLRTLQESLEMLAKYPPSEHGQTHH